MFRLFNRSNTKSVRTSLAVNRLETRDVPSVAFPAIDRATDVRQQDSDSALVAPVTQISTTMDRSTVGARPSIARDVAIDPAIDPVLILPADHNSASMMRGTVGSRPVTANDSAIGLAVVDSVLVVPVNQNSATLNRGTVGARPQNLSADRILINDEVQPEPNDPDLVTGTRNGTTRR
jgi:hypothetical protein